MEYLGEAIKSIVALVMAIIFALILLLVVIGGVALIGWILALLK